MKRVQNGERFYYWNTTTNSTFWSLPPGEEYQETLIVSNNVKHIKSKLFDGKSARYFPWLNVSGSYWWNIETDETPWDIPEDIKKNIKAGKIYSPFLKGSLKKKANKKETNYFTSRTSLCETTYLDTYHVPIPTILVTLKEHLLRLHGDTSEGIFRMAPSESQMGEIRTLITTGAQTPDEALASCVDPNLPATLIKQFFRGLQPGIFNLLGNNLLVQILQDKEPDIDSAILDLDDSDRAAFMWLLDLVSDIKAKQGINKMGLEGLAVVFSVNLWDDNTDPLQLQSVTVTGSKAFEKFVIWRENNN